MKRKILISLLISIMTIIFSFSVFAVDSLEGKENIKIISPRPNVEFISNLDSDYATMPIDEAIKVQLNGSYIDFADENGNVVNPEIINDRTMVPMRKIFESFNASVMWDATTRTVVAKTLEKEITLTIDSDKAKVKNIETNEEKEITLDAAPLILNDRTMVPVRFIAESLEKEVGWDPEFRTVVIIDFEELSKKLEERVPALKDLFEIELDPVESFKTNSEITGKLIYKDSEDKANNETVEMTGDLVINMNKDKEIEMYLDLKFTGKGIIYDSLKEGGFENIKIALIIAGDHMYAMIEQGGKESWVDLGSKVDLSILNSFELANSPASYEEYMNILKQTVGELDSTTYFMLEGMIETFAAIFNEENMSVSGTDSKKTIKFELDFAKFMASMALINPEDVEGMEFNMSVVEKVADKKIESEKVTIEVAFEEPTTKEKMILNFEIDMKYTNFNKDFEIKLPELTVE